MEVNYNIVLVLPYINMNLPWVYTCSPSWTPLPPPSLYHPSGSFQCTNPKHPVSCIEPDLVIRFIYDIIHVSMPFSQIIPPTPSPPESKRLFYTCVCFANPFFLLHLFPLPSFLSFFPFFLSTKSICIFLYCLNNFNCLARTGCVSFHLNSSNTDLNNILNDNNS